jgi:hypothetical protein
MQKYISILSALILMMGLITGCKKNNSDDNVDYSDSVNDKTWGGTMTYTGKTPEYYSVHFNPDKTLTWAQYTGDKTGHWTLKGKKITISFDTITEQIVADISQNNILQNFNDNTSDYEINSSAMIANPNIPLENTVWAGSESNTAATVIQAIQLSFKPGNKVEVKIGNLVFGTVSYFRSAGGSAIHLTGGFFGVMFSGTEMKGCDGGPGFIWQAIKQ